LSEATCWGSCLIAASTRPQVSSAAAYDVRAGVLVRGHDDAEPGAGLDVDVGIHAALTDQAQFGQAFQKSRRDRGPLADQDQGLGVGEAFSQRLDGFDVIGPVRHLVLAQALVAGQGGKRPEPVVEDRDPHRSLQRVTAARRPSTAQSWLIGGATPRRSIDTDVRDDRRNRSASSPRPCRNGRGSRDSGAR